MFDSNDYPIPVDLTALFASGGWEETTARGDDCPNYSRRRGGEISHTLWIEARSPSKRRTSNKRFTYTSEGETLWTTESGAETLFRLKK